MQQIFSFIFVACYLVSLCFMGAFILRERMKTLPILFFATSSFLLGVTVGIPVTYVISYFFTWTGEPMRYAMIVMLLGCGLTGYALSKNNVKKPVTRNPQLNNKLLSDILLLLFSLTFSTWLMTKTFHSGSVGQLFTGSNNVFDFGHLLGLVRSLSWGSNIPFGSPFYAGLPFFYHFFFLFWVALVEYCGVPLVWALNVPSILSFSALLIVIYFFPRIVWKQGIIVGWLAVLLTVTHSTMTFWYLLWEKGLSLQLIKDIWQLPTYPYAGPFDGSVISIFTTLNNYVNQRHLAFSIATALFLYILFATAKGNAKRFSVKHVILVAIGAGLLWYWNMAVSVGLSILITLSLFFQKQIRTTVLFVAAYCCCIFLLMLPYISVFSAQLRFFQYVAQENIAFSSGTWNPFSYLWNNLGILPLVAALGVYALRKDWKRTMPFAVLFVLVCILAVYHHRGFDQKFLSFAIIGVNVLAAVGLGWLWGKGWLAKFIVVISIGVLMVSGVVDLMAIKNEFASQRCDPMNPAPPVTTLIMRFFLSIPIILSQTEYHIFFIIIYKHVMLLKIHCIHTVRKIRFIPLRNQNV